MFKLLLQSMPHEFIISLTKYELLSVKRN